MRTSPLFVVLAALACTQPVADLLRSSPVDTSVEMDAASGDSGPPPDASSTDTQTADACQQDAYDGGPETEEPDAHTHDGGPEAEEPDAASEASQAQPIDPHSIPENAEEGARACAELASYCHPVDHNNGTLADRCHNTGPLGEPEDCLEIREECLALCLTDGG